MDTDYEVPAEVDRVQARVSKLEDSASGLTEIETWQNEFELTDGDSGEPGANRLPASFGIVPDEDDLGREIVIELNALAADGGETLVSRRVKTGFVPGEARLVRMLLYRACAEVSCADGESCGCPIDGACAAPSCIDETVQPDDMPLIDQPGILPPNAGMPKGRGGVIYCEAPLLVCGTDCVNPESDPRYCGDCSNTCPSGHVCEAGSCIDPGDCRNEGVSCTGFSYCDESSGECLPGCTESEQCSGKYELCDTSTHDCVCEPGLERCEEACVDTQSNPAFCGDCETSCPVGNVCEAGICEDPGDCRTNGIGCTGFTYCDESSGECLPGCTESEQCSGKYELCDTSTRECVCERGLERCEEACVDTQSNPAFCGDCETSCPVGNVCEAGICKDPGDCRTNGIGCTGFTYCDAATGACLEGCTASAQCGGKYELCDTSTHDCVCEPGLERCEEACVDTQSNPAFCGDCETSCPVGNECEAGVCKDPRDCRTNGIGCTGFTYCDAATGACLDGCNNNNQCTRDHEVCGPSSHACVCEDGFDRCKAGGPCHSEALVNIPGWCLLQP